MDSRQAARSPAIVIATLNAKYVHASLGLRCLAANMDRHGGAGLRARTVLREFVIQRPPTQVVEELLAAGPAVIGLGIYIRNVVETTQVVRLLKTCGPTSRTCWAARKLVMKSRSRRFVGWPITSTAHCAPAGQRKNRRQPALARQ